jgi:hypothetical protein
MTSVEASKSALNSGSPYRRVFGSHSIPRRLTFGFKAERTNRRGVGKSSPTLTRDPFKIGLTQSLAQATGHLTGHQWSLITARCKSLRER